METVLLDAREYRICSLPLLAERYPSVGRWPYCWRVLLENAWRSAAPHDLPALEAFARLTPASLPAQSIALPFRPSRVLLQDLLGVPVLVDLAALREAIARRGGDPRAVNPAIPVDCVIDHSLMAAFAGSADAREKNEALERERNHERFTFLRWCAGAFERLRVIPPGRGIMHQINLEHLGQVVWTDEADDGPPRLSSETLVGTDSHTPMINALGVLGWGVGGLEAESAMLGRPIALAVPRVVGVRVRGRLREGVTATDLVLTVTALLRRVGVVEAFVEFTGPGLAELPLATRATIANMAPEYGATCVFFPVDRQTIDYLRLTGRSAAKPVARRRCTGARVHPGRRSRPRRHQPLHRRSAAAAGPRRSGAGCRVVRGRLGTRLPPPARRFEPASSHPRGGPDPGGWRHRGCGDHQLHQHL
jgi:aconitate hydratase